MSMTTPRLNCLDASSTARVWPRLLSLLATPGEVFEEVVSTPPTWANWLVPTSLVCLAQVILGCVGGTAASAAELAGTDIPSARLKAPALLIICLGTFAGTGWSAFVLWFIGRVFLKARFSFLKALEVVGLTGIILVLGAV